MRPRPALWSRPKAAGQTWVKGTVLDEDYRDCGMGGVGGMGGMGGMGGVLVAKGRMQSWGS